MKKILTTLTFIIKNWYTFWVKLLTIIGNIKVFKTPLYISYDPAEFDYNIRGEMIRDIESKIEPGDIVLRQYRHYLDSFLIPGDYSHSGIYVGDNKVVHAVAEGVKEVDLIDFCQADKICVLRLAHLDANNLKETAVTNAKSFVGSSYDFLFDSDSSDLYCHEMTAKSYKDVDIPTFPVTLFGYTFKFLKPKYLADSFLKNGNFTKVIEYK